jgi:hypothetical protein
MTSIPSVQFWNLKHPSLTDVVIEDLLIALPLGKPTLCIEWIPAAGIDPKGKGRINDSGVGGRR